MAEWRKKDLPRATPLGDAHYGMALLVCDSNLELRSRLPPGRYHRNLLSICANLKVLLEQRVPCLLKKDARDSSVKYSALGLQAFLPRRPTTNAPKPNTRFLKNIIRETDSHNATLLAREAVESKARLRTLKGEQGNKERGKRHSRTGFNERAPESDPRHHKRRRVEDDDDRERVDHRKSHRQRSKALDSDEGRRERRRERDRKEQVKQSHSDEVKTRNTSWENSKQTRRELQRRRSRSRERLEREHDRNLDRRRRRSRSRSGSLDRDRDRERNRRHHRSRRRRRSYSSSRSRSPLPARRPEFTTLRTEVTRLSERKSPSVSASDSDPLEAIIGPPPPPPEPKVKSRGRGTFASASTMDSHFSTTYDPSADVRPNSDSENDWDQALEALRDRQRWKQQGADRLRSAGFTEEEVEKWEKGGEKGESDVRWSKRGESREWDRGKVLDDEGEIDVEPEWGRLKGT
ncbi:MAG: hypothetical protein M1827_007393 [Pycnora praestabilis]|nr:MAG: hypothetical protein M1827_007393 [Pycnora praestabilis]